MRRRDATSVRDLMVEVTGDEPRMWGSSIVGFGRQTYGTADGRAHDWFVVGFAPRKAALTLYGLIDDDHDTGDLGRLGPHTTGKGCLSLKRLDAVDRDVLVEMVATAWSAGSS